MKGLEFFSRLGDAKLRIEVPLFKPLLVFATRRAQCTHVYLAFPEPGFRNRDINPCSVKGEAVSSSMDTPERDARSLPRFAWGVWQRGGDVWEPLHMSMSPRVMDCRVRADRWRLTHDPDNFTYAACS